MKDSILVFLALTVIAVIALVILGTAVGNAADDVSILSPDIEAAEDANVIVNYGIGNVTNIDENEETAVELERFEVNEPGPNYEAGLSFVVWIGLCLSVGIIILRGLGKI